jgi:RNA polymerase sigma factor (sigma-70 family)
MLVWMTSSIEHTRDEMRELETLLSRIAQGDKEALGMLYERTHGAIYGFALSLVREPSDAEDILQETFLRVYTAAERYRPEGKPMAWMMTIAKNLSRMRLRDAKRTSDLPEEEWERYLSSKPGVSTEDRLLLQAALRQLSDAERQTVMLHAVAGLRHRESAALLEMPLATVLSKYARAVKKLKQAMEADGR